VIPVAITTARDTTHEVDYDELGADWFERRADNDAHARRLVRQLEHLGHKVTLEPAA
jgi:hypothetical protein